MSVNINILVFWCTERKRYVAITFPDVLKIPIFMVGGFTPKLVTVVAPQIWVHNYHNPENNDVAELLLGNFEKSLVMR
jgi:hypothetical protein